MAKNLLAWVLTGVFVYCWFWVGFAWVYLQDIPRGSWEPVWIILTILVALILRRGGVGAMGGNVIETIINRIKTMVGCFLGYLIANLVGLTLFQLQMGSFRVEEYIQGLVVVVASIAINCAIIGSLEEATK